MHGDDLADVRADRRGERSAGRSGGSKQGAVRTVGPGRNERFVAVFAPKAGCAV